MILSIAVALIAALAQETSSGAPTIGSIFHPGEEALWVFESDHARIGYHTSKYLGLDELAGTCAHHFQGGYRLKGAVEVLSTGDLWVNDHGEPVRFVMQALAGEVYSRVELAGGSTKAHIVQGPTARDVAVNLDPSAFLLANNYISHLEIVLALLPSSASAEGTKTTVPMFSGSTLKGFAYTLTGRGTSELHVDALHSKASKFDDSLGESLVFEDGRLVGVDVPAAKLSISRRSEPVEPVVIVPPEIAKPAADLDVEEVRIRHDDAVVAGSIAKTKGATGKLPAVFFVSGSGPQDRNGFSSGLDLGTHEILDHLTHEGFLVLRVDDRGTGASSALPPDPSYLDLVADARACVEFLAKREDVDASRIVLIGHSEGGQTVPILAGEKPAIAAIVLMAAPGRSILEIVADQNRRALDEQKLAPEEIEKQMKDVRAFLAKLSGDEAIDAAGASAGEKEALASRAWFRSHAKLDPLATIRKVTCPVLILQGAKDFQVSPAKDAAALEAALKDAHHPDHELKVLPGLDHLFKKAPGETSQYGDYWKSRPIDPSFFEAVDPWLRSRVLERAR
jgi:pimeloyl-ACP methyl ester carboxylesterase